jgi:phosphatidylinositol glycan class B
MSKGILFAGWGVMLAAVSASAQITIYTDNLGSDWQNWSWDSTINFANTTPVQTGTQSIAVTSVAWGALSLYHPAITAANFGTLEFWIHGGAGGGQSINVQIEDDDTTQSFGPIALSSTSLVAATWKRVVLPLSAFSISTPTFTRIDWMDAAGSGVAQYYLDEIRLVPASASPPLLRGGWAAGLREATAFFDQALDAAALSTGVYELLNAADPNYTARVAGTFVRYDAARYGVTAQFPNDFGTNGTYTAFLRGIAGTNGLSIDTNTSFTYSLRGVNVGIDATSGLHPISPYIYGMAFAPNAAYIAGAGITVNRWGGNHSSRYNWEAGAANRDFDWYFQNFDWDGDDGSAIDFITRNAQGGAASLISIPSLPWIAKDKTSYSYSVAKYGAQQSVDPYWPDKGNGLKPGGQRITNDVTDASVPNRARPGAGDPTNAVYQSEWLQSIAAHYGRVAPNVAPFLAIDNEPELWGDTHIDVHTNPVTYDELYVQFTNYSAMVREFAPGSLIFGPVDSSWWFYWNSEAGWDDKTAHGNKDFIPWWLEKLRSNDVAAGKSSIDVFDFHYYPNNVFNDDVTAAIRAQRVRCTRGFWDPSYIDEGYIGTDHFATYSQPNSNAVMLIPRFRAIVSNYYPGLKLALTEWNMGAEADMSGALAVADALGIFGREDLWLAAYWSNPASNSPVYEAFRLFGNCDGAGRAFERQSVRTVAGGTNQFGAYAARSDDGTRLTVLLINKNPTNDQLVRVALTNFVPVSTATVYRLNRVSGKVEAEPGGPAASTDMTLVAPAYSATLYDFSGATAGGPFAETNSVALSVAMNATNTLVSWSSKRGVHHVLEQSASLTNGWFGVATNEGSGGVYLRQGPRTGTATFFRVRK